jgi:hypothetical protein
LQNICLRLFFSTSQTKSEGLVNAMRVATVMSDVEILKVGKR